MRARHFEHFLSLQSQMAGFRRSRRSADRRETAADGDPALSAAVAEAKGWLAATGKRRYKSAA
jgi:hypothetical protein